MEVWKNHSITMSGCNRGFLVTTYEGLPDIPDFIADFEDRVSETQRLLTLDEALNATPTRWWYTHKKSINGWSLCRRLMEVHFSDIE